ncbi:MAG TPA: AAA family ATPase, partial [Coxiellaceae bacterium]|nr:AAA family ATPase [Coxiellaceae bacterium]
MLTHIHIENFTIIDTLDLEFSKGFSVLTGETGAGKSIIVDAVMLTLGARADINLIREAKERCELVLAFSLHDAPLAQAWLTEHELSNED